MNIFKEIKSNIYDKEYYKGIPNETFSKSVKYLFRLSLIGGLLSLVIFAIMSKDMPNIIKTEVVKLVNEYPEELVITVESGQASINKEEPYVLPMSEDTKKLMEESDNKSTYSNALVIDTKNPFNIENFKKYNAFGLLTKEEIAFMNVDTGEIRIFPLKDIKEKLEISKPWLLENTSKILKAMPIIIVILIPLIYIMFLMAHFVGTLIVNLFFSLFIWVMSKIRDAGLNYKKSYQLGLHAATVYVILSALGMFIYPLNDFVIRTLAVILVAWINFFMDKEEGKEAPVTEVPTN